MDLSQLRKYHYPYYLSVLRTRKATMSEDVVPAHLTNTVLEHQAREGKRLGLPAMAAEAKALLRLDPKQRKAAWEILRDPWRN